MNVEICRDLVGERIKETEDVLVSRAWLKELMRDAYRYRFVRRFVRRGDWVPSQNPWPDPYDVDAAVDAAMETKEWK